MKTFEYRIVDYDAFDDDTQDQMNSMGLKGWNIVKVFDLMPWKGTDGQFMRIVFKRKVVEQKEFTGPR